jgi:hypothetical protein
MWIWTVGTGLLACGLLALGLAWGAFVYLGFAIVCANLGALLFLIASLLWLVGRRWLIPRRIAQVWASAGLACGFQVVPAIPAFLVLGMFEERSAKADCEEVISLIEAWKSDHGEYPEDIAELMPQTSIETSSGEVALVSTRGGAEFYQRCEHGFTIAIPNPWSFENDLHYVSWKSPSWID